MMNWEKLSPFHILSRPVWPTIEEGRLRDHSATARSVPCSCLVMAKEKREEKEVVKSKLQWKKTTAFAIPFTFNGQFWEFLGLQFFLRVVDLSWDFFLTFPSPFSRTCFLYRLPHRKVLLAFLSISSAQHATFSAPLPVNLPILLGKIAFVLLISHFPLPEVDVKRHFSPSPTKRCTK